MERDKLLSEKAWTVISQEFFNYAPTLRAASLKAGQLLAMESVGEQLKASRDFSLVRNAEQRKRSGWRKRRVLSWLRQSLGSRTQETLNRGKQVVADRPELTASG